MYHGGMHRIGDMLGALGGSIPDGFGPFGELPSFARKLKEFCENRDAEWQHEDISWRHLQEIFRKKYKIVIWLRAIQDHLPLAVTKRHLEQQPPQTDRASRYQETEDQAEKTDIIHEALEDDDFYGEHIQGVVATYMQSSLVTEGKQDVYTLLKQYELLELQPSEEELEIVAANNEQRDADLDLLYDMEHRIDQLDRDELQELCERMQDDMDVIKAERRGRLIRVAGTLFNLESARKQELLDSM
jgi:hypothetical protein